MAVATPVAYAAASGQRVLGGRFPIAPPVGTFPAVPTTGLVIGSVLAPAAGTPPCCMGAAFRQGDVAAGTTFSGVQMTPKNAWPDGSTKFALLAFGPSVAANTARAIGLTAGAAPGGAPLTTTQLRAFMTGPATVGAGAFGSATWAGSDWEAPFAQWVSGPLMSSWVYRKPIGSDAHLVAWLEVRLFIDGSVEVLPWVENGYLLVAGPTIKSATYTFSLGGTQRFSAPIDLRHHQRTPLVSGAALSHWLGAEPGVVPRHDAAYMMATELVPSYAATVSPTAAIVTSLPATYVPLQQGSFQFAFTPTNANTGFDRDDMTTGGYGAPIGLLPQHDVLYLTTTANTFAAVVRNGYSAGRYQIHYRDEATNRPVRFSDHPTLVLGSGAHFASRGGSTANNLTPTASGGNGPVWDTAHSPSVGFLAYLLTGRWYFMEEVLFAATVNYLGNGDNAALRNGSQGLHQTAAGAWQTRAAAWGFRTHAQAAAVVPDDDTGLRSNLVASLEANIAHFHGRYVAQANNPFGFILPGEAYDGNFSSFAPWQQDFVTAAWGYAMCLGLPVSSTRRTQMAAFFAWKAQAVTMRLGTSANWWYVNGAPFTMRISPGALSIASFENGTGPWLSTPAEAYAATYASPPSWLGSTEGTLAFEFQPNYTAGVQGMWANLQPALAYAVRHNVSGALAGYNRMVNSSNWAQFQTAFNETPVWAVRPASGTLPAWLQNRPLNTWFEIPGTSGAGGAAADAWGAFAVNDETAELYMFASGGHFDSFDNRGVSLPLAQDAPGWVLRAPPSTAVQPNVSHYADGKPTSRHLYNNIFYIEHLRRVVLVGCKYAYGDGIDFFTVDGFNVDTNTWDAPRTFADIGPYAGEVLNKRTGVVFRGADNGVAPKWTPPSTVVGSGLGASSTGVTLTGQMVGPMAWDPVRQECFSLYFTAGAARAHRFPDVGGAATRVFFNPSAALTQWVAAAPEYPSMDYDTVNGRYLMLHGGETGKVYAVQPDSSATWDMSVLATTGFPTAAPASGAGTNGRFKFIPRLGGFAYLPRASSNVWFLRTVP